MTRPTPRTDAVAIPKNCDPSDWVSADFARQLERELAAAQEALKAAEARAEEYRKDAERMTFLHERCSVTFTFKRDDGTCAMIAGPTNLRAAIDAAMKEPK